MPTRASFPALLFRLWMFDPCPENWSTSASPGWAFATCLRTSAFSAPAGESDRLECLGALLALLAAQTV
eukprot:1712043-Rhodomonas_salina.2